MATLTSSTATAGRKPGKTTLWGAVLIVVFSSILGLFVNEVRGSPLNPWKAYAPTFIAPRIEASISYSQLTTARFVDPRSVRTFAKGHIPGAINLHKDDPRISRLDPRQVVIVYCDSLCFLADATAATLHEKGFSQVYVLSGGLPAWEMARYPIETGLEDLNGNQHP